MKGIPFNFDRFRKYTPGGDIGLACGVLLLLSILILPMPTLLLDLGLAFSFMTAVLILMVSMFLTRPLDFSSFPTLLLLTTILRLSLNVATARLILSHGSEGPYAAGRVVAAFGGFLMGGDVAIGAVVFIMLLIVNFIVITKGLQPYRGGFGSILPGCDAGKTDGDRRRRLVRSHRRNRRSAQARGSRGRKRVLRGHGRRRQIRAR
jgi:hypothetical protein